MLCDLIKLKLYKLFKLNLLEYIIQYYIKVGVVKKEIVAKNGRVPKVEFTC